MKPAIAEYTIGFAPITLKDLNERAKVGGSGILARIGSLNGIVTAAHVIKYLPTKGEIGLVRFTGKHSERLVVQAQHLDSTYIGADNDISDGPDIGFIRLPPDYVPKLEAMGSNFHNLGLRLDTPTLSQEESKPYFDGISGLINDWTTDEVPEKNFTSMLGIEAIFGIGNIEKERFSGEFDLYEFEVDHKSFDNVLNTFQGMSGGGLWRIYLRKDDAGSYALKEKRLLGVVFHESKIINDKQIVTCHGPHSLYSILVAKIKVKWLESVLAT